MVKKKSTAEEKLNYNQEVRLLKETGPARLYLLWGQEDYLREYYLTELKKVCLPEGEDSFSFRRLNGPDLDLDTLREAVDAMPFLTERSFVEIRDVDWNRLKEGEAALKVLEDIPDYCTVALVQGAAFEPDGRIKLVKGLRAAARELKFTAQSQDALIRWISKRFASANKGIELEAAQRLIFVSGDLMNRLIPEIEKVAAYAKGPKVTVEDVNAVASRIPEAVIFEMTDCISRREFNAALSILAELLAGKNSEPIAMIGMLALQMRSLYTARLALDSGLGADFLLDSGAVRYDFQARNLLKAARGYTLEQLRRAVEICVETDYRMKSSGADDAALFQDAVLRIAAGECDA